MKKRTVAAAVTGIALAASSVVAATSVTAVESTMTSNAAPAIAPAAKSVKASGKVKGGAGSTLVVLDGTGRVTESRTLSTSGKFATKITSGSSLHLIDKSGTYAGPIVMAANKKGSLAYTYIGTKKLPKKIDLGTVKVYKGYAKAATDKKSKGKKLQKALYSVVDRATGASSLAKKGVPRAAGSLGVVAVDQSAMLSASGTGLAADLDRDGYPNVFDIDENGNQLLNNVDTAARFGNISTPSIFSLASSLNRIKPAEPCPAPPAAPTPGCTPVGPNANTSKEVTVFSNFKATSPQLTDVVNANLLLSQPGESVIQKINSSLTKLTTLAVQVVPGAEYTCEAPYCPSSPFTPNAGPTGDFQWPIGSGSTSTTPALSPFTLTYQDIGSGDAFLVTDPTTGDTYPGVLNFAFTTTPALKSYKILSSTGVVQSQGDVTYSDAGASIGTASQRITVPRGSRVQLDWYVPQRLAFEGELGFGPEAMFMNMGNLRYFADMPNRPAGVTSTGNGGNCSNGSMYDSAGSPVGGEYVFDSSVDDAATGRTFSFQIDIDKCVDNFYTGGGTTWTAADFDIKAQASNGSDNAALKLYFQSGP